MKRLLLLLLLASPCFAVTTVAQQITNPDGSLASGTAYIRISAPCRSGAVYVGDKTIAVRFQAGAFAVLLVPNDTCVPAATSYTVAWMLNGGSARTQTWVVPTSGSQVTVDSVVVNVTPVCGGTWGTGGGVSTWGGQ